MSAHRGPASSLGLAQRVHDMGIPQHLVERASVAVVTLRRLIRAIPIASSPNDLLVVDVLGPGGTLHAGSLVDEARALVATHLVTEEAARLNMAGYA